MKFIVGSIPEDFEFDPLNEGWTPLKEPDINKAMKKSLPIALILVAIVFVMIVVFDIRFELKLSNFLLAFILVIPIHELLHALVFPNVLGSNKVTIGFWPKHVVFFSYFSGEITRNRFVLSLIMPFSIISVASIFFLGLTEITNSFIVSLSLINASMSYMDVFGVFLVMSQVPGNTVIRNKGEKSFWRYPSEGRS